MARERRERELAPDHAENRAPIISLKAPTRRASAKATVPIRITSASGSGTAAGESRTSETARTPITAGDMPFITAFIQASCLTRSSTGRMTSMIMKDGRKAAVAATAAPPAYLDGTRLLDHEDKTFADGWVGLWTKADSITEFADLEITGTPLK